MQNAEIQAEIQTVPLAQYQKLQQDYELYKQKYELLEHELAQLKRLIFGAKSERFVPNESLPGQLQLDLGGEPAATSAAEDKKESIAYERKKKKPLQADLHGRSPLPDFLPRVVVILEPEEDTAGMKHIGDEITEVLEYKPGSFFVYHYIRRKYARPQSEEQSQDPEQPAASGSPHIEALPTAAVLIAPMPALPIEKGIPGPALLAHLVVSKTVDHLPLYRLMKMFERQALKINDSTLGGWFRAATNLMMPLYKAQKCLILAASYLQVDETTIKVLENEQKGKTHRGYMWVYYAPTEKMALFDYRSGRGRAGPDELLAHFQGTIQSDGYVVYEMFEHRKGIALGSCMAHARRKFDEAKGNDQERASYVLTKIQALYAVERQAREKNLDHAARLSLRKEHARPVFDELEKYLKNELLQALPKSPIGVAISYSLNRWKKLEKYLLDGALEIDNNLVENAIRPVALGRKNYLFAGNDEAAQRLAMLYTFMASCKVNNINPEEWLKDVFIRLPTHPVNQVEQLLPHLWIPLNSYPPWYPDTK
jgi:transposase